jgi:hypothetical protein
MNDNNERINIDQVVSYLSHAFSNAVQDFPQKSVTKDGKYSKGTDLYKLQVDFCYLIDQIQRGPSYITPKAITECNELIDKAVAVKQEVKAKATKAGTSE